MVNTLQFNMSLPTPYVFMKRFLKAAQSDKKVGSSYHHGWPLKSIKISVPQKQKEKKG